MTNRSQFIPRLSADYKYHGNFSAMKPKILRCSYHHVIQKWQNKSEFTQNEKLLRQERKEKGSFMKYNLKYKFGINNKRGRCVETRGIVIVIKFVVLLQGREHCYWLEARLSDGWFMILDAVEAVFFGRKSCTLQQFFFCQRWSDSSIIRTQFLRLNHLLYLMNLDWRLCVVRSMS